MKPRRTRKGSARRTEKSIPTARQSRKVRYLDIDLIEEASNLKKTLGLGFYRGKLVRFLGPPEYDLPTRRSKDDSRDGAEVTVWPISPQQSLRLMANIGRGAFLDGGWSDENRAKWLRMVGAVVKRAGDS